MCRTERDSKKLYFTNLSKWPGHMPTAFWVVAKEWDWDQEFSCSDSFALEINKAIDEIDDPKSHTTYDTVEEFLKSLGSR